jgi:hypothetical protein
MSPRPAGSYTKGNPRPRPLRVLLIHPAEARRRKDGFFPILNKGDALRFEKIPGFLRLSVGARQRKGSIQGARERNALDPIVSIPHALFDSREKQGVREACAPAKQPSTRVSALPQVWDIAKPSYQIIPDAHELFNGGIIDKQPSYNVGLLASERDFPRRSLCGNRVNGLQVKDHIADSPEFLKDEPFFWG